MIVSCSKSQKRRKNKADHIKVRLKDGDGNILHPETDWSVVLNKPSINESFGVMSITPDRGISINAEEGISISTNDTGNNNIDLADFPINWSALSHNPFAEDRKLGNSDNTSTSPSSIQNIVFGIYQVLNGSMGITYYPAFAISSWMAATDITIRNSGFYINNSGILTKITDMSNFRGFLK